MLNQRIRTFARELNDVAIPLGSDAENAGRVLIVRMHVAGINVRYLGALRRLCKAPFWRLIMLKQMVTRRLKSFYLVAMQAESGRATTRVQTFLRFFNLTFGGTPVSDAFWQDVLFPSLTEYFGSLDETLTAGFKSFCLSPRHDEIFALANYDARPGLSAFRFLVDFSKRIHAVWSATTIFRFSVSPLHLISVRDPFTSTDLAEAGIVPLFTKHIPYGFYAAGRVKLLKAMQLSGHAAFASFLGAAVNFAHACDIYSSSKVLRNLGVCVAFANDRLAARVYFDLALRVDPAGAAKTHTKMALVHEANREFTEAEDHYLKALECATVPKVSAIVSYVDFLSYSRGDFEWATRYYEAILRISPFQCRCLYNLGLLVARADAPRAIALLYKALDCAENVVEYVEICEALQDLLQRVERHEQAKVIGGRIEKLSLGGDEEALDEGPLFLLVSHSPDAFSDLRMYMGKDAKQIRRVSVTHSFLLDLNTSTREQFIRAKAAFLAKSVQFPCVCQQSYLCVGGRYWTAKKFAAIDVAAFAKEHEGEKASLGVVVAHHDLITCHVYESSIKGIIVLPRGEVVVKCCWETIFQPKGFKMAISDMPVRLRSLCSPRRLAYLKLILNHVEGK